MPSDDKETIVIDKPDEEEIRVSRLLYAEGKALLDAGTHEAALAKLDQVLAHNPYHLPALGARATGWEKLGEHERADHCRQRIEWLRRSNVGLEELCLAS